MIDERARTHIALCHFKSTYLVTSGQKNNELKKENELV